MIDLKPFMSDRMWDWAQGEINQGLQSDLPNIYYGVTTRALKTDLQEYGAVYSKVTVSTQRQESVGASSNSKVIYKDIEISFVKEDGIWKVDSAFWQ